MVARTDYNNFQKKIGYNFKDLGHLKLALTHSSYANELTSVKKRTQYNERIEFLGDAVLELVSSDYIYRANETMSEGNMTKLRASIVCEPTLAACARQIGLEEYILLGKGEEATGGRRKDSIVSDTMEAVIGAIYLDGGLASAKEFIRSFILNDLESKQLFYDSKTILQEYVQARGMEFNYELLGEQGPEHDKIFEMAVVLNGTVFATGKGNSKKHAQQHAAYAAILKLRKVTNVSEEH